MKSSNQRPKTSTPLANMQRHPSEFNLLNLNHSNVQQYLLKEKQRQLFPQAQQQSFDENNVYQKRNISEAVQSPGASSIGISDSKKESVQVFIRVRPPFSHEVDEDQSPYYLGPQGQQDMDQMPIWSCVKVTPPSWVTLHNYQEGTQRDFQYSQVFGEQSSQAEIFQYSALPLVFHILNGYHGCYFVYGQTGTGKTHSMGVLNKINRESEGIIPSSLDFIFRYFEEQSRQTDASSLLEWKVHLSFFQIYQEQIQDLFNPANKNLQIREEFGEVFVEDLVEVPVKNLHQAITIINAGLEHRQMASQNMNSTSSRSHTILNVDVYQTKQISYNKVQQISGRLTLVDLAGSERVRSTTSNGTRLEEAKHINASLSALGNVISSLANQKQQFIPYRSSKLTRVLQNSLSGSSKIVVLATLGPGAKNFQESLSTLQFAQRCKEIQLTPMNHASIIQDDEEVSALKEKIMELQIQLDIKDREHNEAVKLNDKQIFNLEEEVQLLKSQLNQHSQKQELSQKDIKQKNQYLSDICQFAIMMLIKFVESSSEHVNEAFDLNQQLLQLQQTITTSSKLVQELESEFPFVLDEKVKIQAQEIPSTEELQKEDINIKAVVNKLTNLAKKHLEHLNFLSETANSQILLKQFTREHLEDLQLKKENLIANQRENLLIILQELIQVKAHCLKFKVREQMRINRSIISQSRMNDIKATIRDELRTYISDEIASKLNFLDGCHFTESQEEFIDNQLLNLDFLSTLSMSPESPRSSHDDSITKPMASLTDLVDPNIKLRKEPTQKQDSSNKQTKKQQNLSDAFIKLKLLESFDDDEKKQLQSQSSPDYQQEEDLSDLVMKQNFLPNKQRRNELTFKKQTNYTNEDRDDASLQSSSERVIIEEEKESDYTHTIESQVPQSTQKQVVMNPSQQQYQPKKMPARSEDDMMKADKLIILSKYMTERCFLKFFNYFIKDENTTQRATNQVNKSKGPENSETVNQKGVIASRQLIIKKKNSNNAVMLIHVKQQEMNDFIEENNFMESKEDSRLSQMIREAAIQNQSIRDNRFTFQQKVPGNNIFKRDKEY